MKRLGITGHQSIPGAALEFVAERLAREIASVSPAEPVVGVTSLAAGADQLFAAIVIRGGGSLHVVVPASGYETTFDNEGRREFRRLLESASEVEVLPYEAPTEEAFFAAGKRVVHLCDVLLAVWDGEPSRGLGGTADVVRFARQSGRDVRVIWPAGVTR
ncbi:MAG: hypothetical protein M3P70_01075 [Actinomycetota bacterium]|nr:hypothetical protein [Actinomycetota bacterium]